MSHNFAANFVHCIFSTKDRRDLIPSELQARLGAYLGGISRKLGVDLLAAGGTANHVHLLIGLSPNLRLVEVIQKLKANSSRWLGEQGVAFEWQQGYGAFSVSPSLLQTVKAYIHNQESHHRKRDFDEEWALFLKKSGVRHEPPAA
jgi:REP element-mobilizing transposase RayT